MKKKLDSKFGEIIKNDTAISCKVVFILAKKFTAIGLFPSFSDTYCLRDDIIISREIIINAGIVKKSSPVIEITYDSTMQINNLSAKRSNKAPRLDTVCVFLAT